MMTEANQLQLGLEVYQILREARASQRKEGSIAESVGGFR
jgi:hypothetical protein